MKNLKKIIAAFASLILLLSFTGCGKRNALNAPKYFEINAENELLWTIVPSAKRYSVSITDQNGSERILSERTNKTNLSTLEAGNYVIKVKAIGDGKKTFDSDWSEKQYFGSQNKLGLVYKLAPNGNSYEISKVGRAEGDIIIEPTYLNKPVIKIGESAFRNATSVTSLVIPDSVTEIDKYAFYNCTKMTSVTLPDSIKSIGEAAFQSCTSLESVKMPLGVTVLNKNVFAYCKSLVNIDIHDNITTIGDAAFTRADSVKEIKLPEKLYSIGEEAFSMSAALEKVTFGSELFYIGNRAFASDTSLKQVVFAEQSNFTYSGREIFANCTSLEEIALPEGMAYINTGAFKGCTLLKKINVPDSVTDIGENAFRGTELLESQKDNDFQYIGKWLISCGEERSKTLTSIERDSFSAYESENNLQIEGIASAAFREFEVLEEVMLPFSVKYIGSGAFIQAPALNKFVARPLTSERGSRSSLITIGDSAFRSCEKLDNVQFDSNGSLETIGSYAFYDCTLLSIAEGSGFIPNSVQRIGSFAFKNTKTWTDSASDDMVYIDNWIVGWRNQIGAENEVYEELTKEQFNSLSDADQKKVLQIINTNEGIWNSSPYEVTIKETTRGISDFAFYHMYTQTISGLDTTTRVLNIGQGAFYKCKKLTGITLNPNTTEIKDHTFYRCEALTSFDIPRRLETIGESAFYGCKSLTSIDLTRSSRLTDIGDYAFSDCKSLSEIKLATSSGSSYIKNIGNYAFYGCDNSGLTSITLPKTLESLGVYAFANCAGLESVTIDGTITEIPAYAFSDCVSLKGIEIKDGITKIDAGAFFGCSSLSEITLGKDVEEIGDYAFSGVLAQNIAIPASVKSIGAYAFRNTLLTSLVIGSGVQTIGSHLLFGNNGATIYAEGSTPENGWAEKWNSSFRPVVYGCVLSADKSYVVSITVTEKTFENTLAEGGLTAPQRSGYEFVGWSYSEGGNAEVSAKDLPTVASGRTVYAVWREKA